MRNRAHFLSSPQTCGAPTLPLPFFHHRSPAGAAGRGRPRLRRLGVGHDGRVRPPGPDVGPPAARDQGRGKGINNRPAGE